METHHERRAQMLVTKTQEWLENNPEARQYGNTAGIGMDQPLALVKEKKPPPAVVVSKPKPVSKLSGADSDTPLDLSVSKKPTMSKFTASTPLPSPTLTKFTTPLPPETSFKASSSQESQESADEEVESDTSEKSDEITSFRCCFCGASFTSTDVLLEHIRIHTGDSDEDGKESSGKEDREEQHIEDGGMAGEMKEQIRHHRSPRVSPDTVSGNLISGHTSDKVLSETTASPYSLDTKDGNGLVIDRASSSLSVVDSSVNEDLEQCQTTTCEADSTVDIPINLLRAKSKTPKSNKFTSSQNKSINSQIKQQGDSGTARYQCPLCHADFDNHIKQQEHQLICRPAAEKNTFLHTLSLSENLTCLTCKVKFSSPDVKLNHHCQGKDTGIQGFNFMYSIADQIATHRHTDTGVPMQNNESFQNMSSNSSTTGDNDSRPSSGRSTPDSKKGRYCEGCNKSFEFIRNLSRHLQCNPACRAVMVAKDPSSVKRGGYRFNFMKPKSLETASDSSDPSNQMQGPNTQPSRRSKQSWSPKGYTCKQCGKSFKDGLKLGVHTRWEHRGLQPYVKPKGKKWKHNSLRKSVRNLTDKVISCKACQKTFKLENNLQLHLNLKKKCRIQHNKLKKLEETNSTNNDNSTDEALQGAERERPACKVCGHRYWSVWHLKSHMRACHKNIPAVDDSKEKTVEPAHLVCRKYYTRDDVPEALKHMENHNGIYSCTICKHMFNQKKILFNHVLIHLKINPFKCLLCDYRGRQVACILNHLKTTHLNVLQAEYSSKTTESIGAIRDKHGQEVVLDLSSTTAPQGKKVRGSPKMVAMKKVSTSPKKVEVKEISASPKKVAKKLAAEQTKEKRSVKNVDFAYVHNKMDDVYLKETPNGWKCTQCDAIYGSKSRTICHIRKHTRTRPYKCSHCNFTASYSYMIYQHLRKFHYKNRAIRAPFIKNKGRGRGTVRDDGQDVRKPGSSVAQRQSEVACTVPQILPSNATFYSSFFKALPIDKKYGPISVDNNIWKCFGCEKTSNDPTLIRNHALTHTQLTPFHCLLCPFKTGIMTKLILHLQELHRVELQAHFGSNAQFEDAQDENQEMEMDNTSKDISPRVSSRGRQLKHGDYIHDFTEPDQSECEISAKPAESSTNPPEDSSDLTFQVIMLPGSREKIYICPQCNFKSNYESVIQAHMAIKHSNGQRLKEFNATKSITISPPQPGASILQWKPHQWNTGKQVSTEPSLGALADNAEPDTPNIIPGERLTVQISKQNDIIDTANTLYTYRAGPVEQNTDFDREPRGGYRCGFCKERPQGKAAAIAHLQEHTGEMPFCCDLCDVKDAHRAQILMHIQASHMDQVVDIVEKKRRLTNMSSVSDMESSELEDLQTDDTFDSTTDADVNENLAEMTDSEMDLTNAMPVADMLEAAKPFNLKGIRKKNLSFYKQIIFVRGPKEEKLHIEQDRVTGRFLCPYCKKTFSGRNATKQHSRIHTHEKPYYCKLCYHNARNISSIMKHLQAQHKDNCRTKRGLSKLSKSSLAEIKRARSQNQDDASSAKNSNDKPDGSKDVMEKSPAKEMTNEDEPPTKGRSRPSSPSIFQEFFTFEPGEVEKNLHIKPDSNGHCKCPFCNKVMLNSYNTKRHIRIHTEEKPFTCNLCDYNATQYGSVRFHLVKKHADVEQIADFLAESDKEYQDPELAPVEDVFVPEQPGISKDINQMTSSSYMPPDYSPGKKQWNAKWTGLYEYEPGPMELKYKDMRRHVISGKYKCPLCYKDHFREKGKFLSHLRIHSGEKPYQCNLCMYRAGQQSTIVHHVRNYHKLTETILENQKMYANATKISGPFKEAKITDLCQETEEFESKGVCESNREIDMPNTSNEMLISEKVSSMDASDETQELLHSQGKKTAEAMQSQTTSEATEKDISVEGEQSPPLTPTKAIRKMWEYIPGDIEKNLTLLKDPNTAYSCPYCHQEKFATVRPLKAHIRTHTLETPFYCKRCNYKCRQLSSMRYHLQKEHIAEWLNAEALEPCASPDRASSATATNDSLEPCANTDVASSATVTNDLLTKDTDNVPKWTSSATATNDSLGKDTEDTVDIPKTVQKNADSSKTDNASSIPKMVQKDVNRSKTDNASSMPHEDAPSKPKGDGLVDQDTTKLANPLLQNDSSKDFGAFTFTCGPMESLLQGQLSQMVRDTVSKLFACSSCSQGFTTKYSYLVHMRLHTGEKPYRCKLCPHLSVQHGSMKYHVKKNHSQEEIENVSKVVETSAVSKQVQNVMDDSKEVENTPKASAVPDKNVAEDLKEQVENISKDENVPDDSEEVEHTPKAVYTLAVPTQDKIVAEDLKEQVENISIVDDTSAVPKREKNVLDDSKVMENIPKAVDTSAEPKQDVAVDSKEEIKIISKAIDTSQKQDRNVTDERQQEPMETNLPIPANDKSDNLHKADRAIQDQKNDDKEQSKTVETIINTSTDVLETCSSNIQSERPSTNNVQEALHNASQTVPVHISNQPGQRLTMSLQKPDCILPSKDDISVLESYLLKNKTCTREAARSFITFTIGMVERNLSFEKHPSSDKFICPFCQSLFVSLEAVKKHVRLHTGERPYSCNICDNQEFKESKMIQHIIEKHGRHVIKAARRGVGQKDSDAFRDADTCDSEQEMEVRQVWACISPFVTYSFANANQVCYSCDLCHHKIIGYHQIVMHLKRYHKVEIRGVEINPESNQDASQPVSLSSNHVPKTQVVYDRNSMGATKTNTTLFSVDKMQNLVVIGQQEKDANKSFVCNKCGHTTDNQCNMTCHISDDHPEAVLYVNPANPSTLPAFVPTSVAPSTAAPISANTPVVISGSSAVGTHSNNMPIDMEVGPSIGTHSIKPTCKTPVDMEVELSITPCSITSVASNDAVSSKSPAVQSTIASKAQLQTSSMKSPTVQSAVASKVQLKTSSTKSPVASEPWLQISTKTLQSSVASKAQPQTSTKSPLNQSTVASETCLQASSMKSPTVRSAVASKSPLASEAQPQTSTNSPVNQSTVASEDQLQTSIKLPVDESTDASEVQGQVSSNILSSLFVNPPSSGLSAPGTTSDLQQVNAKTTNGASLCSDKVPNDVKLESSQEEADGRDSGDKKQKPKDDEEGESPLSMDNGQKYMTLRKRKLHDQDSQKLDTVNTGDEKANNHNQTIEHSQCKDDTDDEGRLIIDTGESFSPKAANNKNSGEVNPTNQDYVRFKEVVGLCDTALSDELRMVRSGKNNVESVISSPKRMVKRRRSTRRPSSEVMNEQNITSETSVNDRADLSGIAEQSGVSVLEKTSLTADPAAMFTGMSLPAASLTAKNNQNRVESTASSDQPASECSSMTDKVQDFPNEKVDETCITNYFTRTIGNAERTLSRNVQRDKNTGYYLCPYCDKSARLLQTTKIHMRLHTGERPYECKLCDVKTVQHCSIINHIKNYHQEVLGIAPKEVKRGRKRKSKKVVSQEESPNLVALKLGNRVKKLGSTSPMKTNYTKVSKKLKVAEEGSAVDLERSQQILAEAKKFDKKEAIKEIKSPIDISDAVSGSDGIGISGLKKFAQIPIPKLGVTNLTEKFLKVAMEKTESPAEEPRRPTRSTVGKALEFESGSNAALDLSVKNTVEMQATDAPKTDERQTETQTGSDAGKDPDLNRRKRKLKRKKGKKMKKAKLLKKIAQQGNQPEMMATSDMAKSLETNDKDGLLARRNKAKRKFGKPKQDNLEKFYRVEIGPIEKTLKFDKDPVTQRIKCSYCSMTLSHLWGAFNHVRLHTGEKPFICNLCGYKAVQLTSLKTHLNKTHHDIVAAELRANLESNSNTNNSNANNSSIQNSAMDIVTVPFPAQASSSASADITSITKPLPISDDQGSFNVYNCFSFVEPDGIKTQQFKKDPISGLMICPKCDGTVAQRMLMEHICSHTGDLPYRCKLCAQKTAKRSAIIRHIQMYHREDAFSKYVPHPEEEALPASFDQGQRSEAEGQRSHLFRNKMLKKKNKLKVMLGYKKSGKELTTVAQNNEKDAFVGNVCEEPLRTGDGRLGKFYTLAISKMEKQMVIQKLENGMFGCPYCSSQFLRSADVKRHARGHTGDKPYKCRLCNQTSTQQDGIKKHIDKVHAAEVKASTEAATMATTWTCNVDNVTKGQGSHLQEEISVNSSKILEPPKMETSDVDAMSLKVIEAKMETSDVDAMSKVIEESTVTSQDISETTKQATTDVAENVGSFENMISEIQSNQICKFLEETTENNNNSLTAEQVFMSAEKTNAMSMIDSSMTSAPTEPKKLARDEIPNVPLESSGVSNAMSMMDSSKTFAPTEPKKLARDEIPNVPLESSGVSNAMSMIDSSMTSAPTEPKKFVRDEIPNVPLESSGKEVADMDCGSTDRQRDGNIGSEDAESKDATFGNVDNSDTRFTESSTPTNDANTNTKDLSKPGETPINVLKETPDKFNNQEPAIFNNQKPFKFSNQEPTKFNNQEPNKFSNQEPAKNNNQEPTKFNNQEPAKFSNQEPAKNNNQEPAKFSNQEPAKFSNQEPAKNNNQEPAKFSNQEPAKFSNQELMFEDIDSDIEVGRKPIEDILEDLLTDVDDDQPGEDEKRVSKTADQDMHEATEDGKQEPKSKGQADQKQESESAVQAERRPESKLTDHADQKVESESIGQADRKQESKSSDQADRKQESKLTDQADQKRESKSSDQDDRKQESKPADQAEVQKDRKSASKSAYPDQSDPQNKDKKLESKSPPDKLMEEDQVIDEYTFEDDPMSDNQPCLIVPKLTSPGRPRYQKHEKQSAKFAANKSDQSTLIPSKYSTTKGQGSKRHYSYNPCDEADTMDVISETNSSMYKCPHCTYRHRIKSVVRVHIRTHTGSKPYTCHYCDFTSTHFATIRRHLWKEHNIGEELKSSSSDAETHHTKTGESLHFQFHPSEDEKDLVFKRSVDKGAFLCSYCNRPFSTEGNLRIHIRTHTGDKPYQCRYCQYKTAYGFLMQKHINMAHKDLQGSVPIDDSKPIMGQDYAFTPSEEECSRVLRRKSGSDMYKCEICGRESVHEHDAVTHMRTHTGDTPYSCAYCDTQTKSQVQIVKHVNDMHKSSPKRSKTP